jgi:gliding motility-associated-like protein
MIAPLRVLLSSLLFLCYSLLHAQLANGQALVREWDRTLGNAGKNNLNRMRPTSDGGFILGGQTDPAPGGDVGEPAFGVIDYWVVKVDAQGKKQWDRVMGGTSDEYVTDIEQTSDGGYIVGGWSSSSASGNKSQPSRGGIDYWVVKLDAQGQTQWDRTLGGSSNDYMSTIAQTPDGGYILVGSSSSPVSGEKSAPYQALYQGEPWLIKLDAQGNKQWDRTLSGISDASSLAVLPTSDGGYMLGSSVLAPTTGGQSTQADYRLMKLTSSGQKQWEKSFGGSGNDWLIRFTRTADNGYILGGTSDSGISGDKSQPHLGNGDFWIVKVDELGNLQWERTLGTSEREYFGSVWPTHDGNYLVGGNTTAGISGNKTQPSAGENDYWIVQLNANGAVQWDRAVGGSANEELVDALSTTDGGYVLGGSSFSGISGDKSQPNVGGYTADMWLIKLRPDKATLQVLGAAPLCSGNQLTLTTSHNSATPAVAYQWNTGATTPTLVVTQPGTYSVTVTFASGLKLTSQQQVVPFTTALRITGETLLCPSSPSVALQAQDPAATSFRWSTGAATPSISVTQPGTYSVSASYPGGCTATSTHIVTTASALHPFTLGSDTTLCEGQTLLLVAPAHTPATATYRWSDGSTGPTLLVQRPGTYSLRVTNACQTITASRLVSATSCLTIPNVITPNNDRHNDFWVVQGLVGQWSLTLYNRWGRTIYSTDSYQNNWGSGAVSGVYYYQLRQPSTGATYKGWLQVL